MKKRPGPAGAGNSVPAPYQAAFLLHQQNQLGASVARSALKLNIMLSAALLISLIVILGLGWKVAHPPVKYFATVNGRVVEIFPTDQPAYSQDEVTEFGAATIRKAFTLDFVHYKQQMNAVSDRFSREGYISYYNALTASNVLSSITGKKMNLSPSVEPGVVRTKGLLDNGVYAWEIQYPVSLKLEGQTNSLPAQRFIFSVFIQRADVTDKPDGLEVTQLVTLEPQ
ncbi:conjugal transfer protein TraM (plasmid) [Yersinia similis]|uniref:Conjugal transfer protein TraM n=1 Tax=Yersinia similis TaxID=367190 RepID=A0ABM5Q3Y8_9GAMM|nr:DotI/IcmL/TraM family protein [Yersinia similis]AHK22099.1 conjugal transfer protein TraM [Yersinia similis]CFQ66628.1 Macrophage killing protein with similarity to conjugation protein [Yersinia similis]